MLPSTLTRFRRAGKIWRTSASAPPFFRNFNFGMNNALNGHTMHNWAPFWINYSTISRHHSFLRMHVVLLYDVRIMYCNICSMMENGEFPPRNALLCWKSFGKICTMYLHFNKYRRSYVGRGVLFLHRSRLFSIGVFTFLVQYPNPISRALQATMYGQFIRVF